MLRDKLVRAGRVAGDGAATTARDLSNRARGVAAGPILSSEANGVMAATAGVRGVQGVVDELERHETAAGIPSLQGEGRVAQPALDILQRRWSPATRTLVGAGALAIGAWAVAHSRQPRQSPPPGGVM